VENLETKLQEILTCLNNTFNINIEETNDKEEITKITLNELKNDGSELLEKFLGLFGPVLEQITNGEKNIVYEEGTGLAIRNIGEN